MKLNITSGRLNYEPKFDYNTGVLIGNWFEIRSKYIHEKHKHATKYSTDFCEKPQSFVHPNIYWNHRIKAEGLGARILMDHERDKYHNNYSTTYNASFNILPKSPEKNKLRTFHPVFQHYMPQQDFANNYGNTTNFGLEETKKQQWDYDKQIETKFWSTELKDEYKAPKLSDYTIKRKATPREISSIMSKFNRENPHLTILTDFPLDVKPRMYPHFYF